MIKKLMMFWALCVGLALSATALRAEKVEVEHSAASHVATHEEKAPELVPELDSKETWTSALWVVIIFAVMLAVLYPTAWKKVLIGLRDREARIRKDIKDAEEASAKAAKTLQEYNAKLATAEGQIRDMLANATRDAERLATEIRMSAQKDSEENKLRATREIEAAKKQALTEIYATAAEMSTSIAAKILRRNINVDDQRDLVNRGLEELGSIR
jgi:F-type H+-transporting ATPase subunit b